MGAYLLDWTGLLLRWAHFVTGIAWIGSSLYFIWLDNHLLPPREAEDAKKGVAGEVWSVHGGGFYHAQKYQLAPGELPAPLHWFKWEAYSTWLTGMFLLGLVYFLGAEIYLIDPAVAALSPAAAIGLSLAFIAGGWIVYDLLCRTPLVKNDAGFAMLLLLLCTLLAWSLCSLFSGRAAYILFGAVLGTIMVANVFFVIIPGQKEMVAAAERGETPDAAPGLRGKQRSVHNTYFTLPVLFVMTSNHFAMTYSHRWNWLILIAIAVVGALVRIWFVQRHRGHASPLLIASAVAILLLTIAAVRPVSTNNTADVVDFGTVQTLVQERCGACHSASPSHPSFPAAPLGIVFDSAEEIRADADRIYQQTVVTRGMPIGNLTGMTEDERQIVAAWYESERKAR